MNEMASEKTISKEIDDKVTFMTFIITKFARAYKMSSQQAYLYLKQYGGVDFLGRHWWALHTDNPFWSIRDLYEVCNDKGGAR